MPPGKSVSAHKDTFFECQKMTIAEIFVKKAKKAGFGDKNTGIQHQNAGIGIECAAPRKREVQCSNKGKAFDNVSTRFNLTFSLFCALS